ncbi:MAG TPA: hypothetical protein VEF36_00560, partial [Roseiarcus sp.]|nr:hypothetical protein [Roseiarcus sp.]
MKGRLPQPSGLEPIETASRDELAALQTTRLRRTLNHAYEKVPDYRAKFDAAGVHPSELKRAPTPSPPARALPTSASWTCATPPSPGSNSGAAIPEIAAVSGHSPNTVHAILKH